jgi:hypothetical protein
MTPKAIRCAALAVLAMAVGCAPVQVAEPAAVVEPVAAAPDAQARAQAAMAAFSGRLRSELGQAIQRDGALGAIDFCKVEAPRIADQVMAGHGVRLGRVAVPGRHRNPGNVADGWQALALADFQAAVAAGGAPEAQVLAVRDGLPAGVELRVARGIRVEPACLLCHGTTVAPELAARIRQRYPDDRATGFSEGDLRGAIWAEVTRREPEAP